MVTVADVLENAARRGITVDAAKVKAALAGIDQAAVLAGKKAAYTVVSWDGTDPCPFDSASRWLHEQDGISKKAKLHFANGGVAYWVFKDGDLKCWQPFDHNGLMMTANPADERHWQKAADRHVAKMAQADCDTEVLRRVISEAV